MRYMRYMDFRKLLLATAGCLVCLSAPAANAIDDWRDEFEATCAKTDIAMTLSTDELLALTSSCDRLEKVIDGLDKTERKVYQKRLQMCKNLYLFVLETKSHEHAGK